MKLCLFKAFQGHTQVTLVPGQDIHPASVSSIDRLCSFNHIRLDINTRRARNKPERSSGLGPRGRGVIKLPKSRCSMFSLSALRLLHCWPQMIFVLKYKGKVLNFKLRQENITWKKMGGVFFLNIVEFDLHKSQEFYGDKMWWKKVPGDAFSTSPAARHLPTFARAGKGCHSVFVCSVSSSQDLQFAVQAELSPGPHRLTAQRFLAAAFEGVVTSCYKRLKNSLHLQHTWPALPFKHASLLLKNAGWPKDKQGKLRPVYSWDFFSILCNKKKLDFHKELLATSYCDMTFSEIVYCILNLLQTTWYMWIYVE